MKHSEKTTATSRKRSRDLWDASLYETSRSADWEKCALRRAVFVSLALIMLAWLCLPMGDEMIDLWFPILLISSFGIIAMIVERVTRWL